MKNIFLFISLFFAVGAFSQNAYKDSINKFIRSYVDNHEVVKGHAREHMQFYPVDEKYYIVATFKKAKNTQWFPLKTSGLIEKVHRVYGTLTFKINDTVQHLNIYQSQDLLKSDQYKNYLFVPFTDATTGTETYGSGRYIDLTFEAIKGDKVIIDFNKAYNPYCAYVSGKYNCPLPPRENTLSIPIRAGEKAFNSAH